MCGILARSSYTVRTHKGSHRGPGGMDYWHYTVRTRRAPTGVRAVGTTRSARMGVPARSGRGCQQKPAPIQSGIRPRSLFLHGPHSHRGQGGWHYPVRTVGRMGVPPRSGRACTLLSLQDTSLSGESGQSGIQSHQAPGPMHSGEWGSRLHSLGERVLPARSGRVRSLTTLTLLCASERPPVPRPYSVRTH